jgi:hypothetical protein
VDPDITLQELRLAVSAWETERSLYEANRFCELFSALDEWLIHGGYVPTSWGTIRFPRKED